MHTQKPLHGALTWISQILLRTDIFASDPARKAKSIWKQTDKFQMYYYVTAKHQTLKQIGSFPVFTKRAEKVTEDSHVQH